MTVNKALDRRTVLGSRMAKCAGGTITVIAAFHANVVTAVAALAVAVLNAIEALTLMADVGATAACQQAGQLSIQRVVVILKCFVQPTIQQIGQFQWIALQVIELFANGGYTVDDLCESQELELVVPDRPAGRWRIRKPFRKREASTLKQRIVLKNRHDAFRIVAHARRSVIHVDAHEFQRRREQVRGVYQRVRNSSRSDNLVVTDDERNVYASFVNRSFGARGVKGKNGCGAWRSVVSQKHDGRFTPHSSVIKRRDQATQLMIHRFDHEAVLFHPARAG